MRRRDFLKQTGPGALALAGMPGVSIGRNASDTGSSLLLEAERFDDKGGWTVDSQFFDELGFAYLLAHGLGEPVGNAKTTATFPRQGRYWVWVRTKDWVPGDWDAPGRFELKVNGESVGQTFGTRLGWGWQKAGPIEIASRRTTVELADLTGFDGRCDAIYFSQNPNDDPPNDRKTLTAWRQRKAGMPDTPDERRDFDVVVVGGGLAGCAAALAADQQG